jgi:hypothetical protein
LIFFQESDVNLTENSQALVQSAEKQSVQADQKKDKEVGEDGCNKVCKLLTKQIFTLLILFY